MCQEEVFISVDAAGHRAWGNAKKTTSCRACGGVMKRTRYQRTRGDKGRTL